LIEIVSNRADEMRVAVVASTRFGGPAARPEDFERFMKQLRLRGVAELIHLGGLVDVPPGTCKKAVAGFAVRSWPLVAPEITTYALCDNPVEPAMRAVGRRDWIDLPAPQMTIVHGPSLYRLPVELVYAPAGHFKDFIRSTPVQHVADRLIVVGGAHGYDLVERGRTLIVNAGAFSGRRGRRYMVGGVIISVRFGSRVEKLTTNFFDFNHDTI
jgi:hypothetical protein